MFRYIAFTIACLTMCSVLIADDYTWPALDDYEWPAITFKEKEVAPMPPPQDEAPKQAITDLPVVWAYFSPSYCPPCEECRKDIKEGKFVGKFRIIEGTPPPGLAFESYPTFHWNDIDGKGRMWPPPTKPGENPATNYPGAAKFISLWESTQIKEAPKPPKASAPRLNYQINRGARWTYPGNISSHIVGPPHYIKTEGLNMNRIQMEVIHDWLHEGVGAFDIQALLSGFRR